MATGSTDQPASGDIPGEDGASNTHAATATNCPYCLSSIATADETETCPGCRTVHHRECWQENGGCAVYGCAQVPCVGGRRAIEVPLSYWGQENKLCPSCGQQILAAAIRCRHCSATFSARPQAANEFQQRAELEAWLPSARKQVVLVFVLSVIPFTAPLAAAWGWVWRSSHREQIAALPPLHAALHKIGFFTSLALTAALAAMTALYVAVRGG